MGEVVYLSNKFLERKKQRLPWSKLEVVRDFNARAKMRGQSGTVRRRSSHLSLMHLVFSHDTVHTWVHVPTEYISSQAVGRQSMPEKKRYLIRSTALVFSKPAKFFKNQIVTLQNESKTDSVFE